jgi:hypothetical protein
MATQFKLLDFENSHSKENCAHLPFMGSQDLYKELESSGYVDNYKARVLKLLWDLELHESDDVVRQGGKQYNARINELRKEGWNIVSVRQGKKFKFQLQSREQRWKV